MERRIRLRKKGDVRRVYEEGRSWVHPLLVLIARASGLDISRVGVTASRKVGGAIARNRSKRVMREAARSLAHRFGAGWDVVLVARAEIVTVKGITSRSGAGISVGQGSVERGKRGQCVLSAIYGCSQAVRAMSSILLGFIRAYQKTLSRILPPTCRFAPSCSQFGYEAISRYGVWRGGWLTMKRVARCHPFNPGGYDPVPDL